MLSQKALQGILGIKDTLHLAPQEMAENLDVTFFPYEKENVSREVLVFADELKSALKELKVNIVPFEESLRITPMTKVLRRFVKIILNNTLYFAEKIFHIDSDRIYINGAVIRNLLRRSRVKSGISIIAVGEGASNNLPMDHTASFTKSLVVSIVDKPENISETSHFHEHFDTAMTLFAHHMCNIILAVDDENWTLYNFNASHPTYKRGVDFKDNLLSALISKLAAPMQPQRLADFEFRKKRFDATEESYTNFTNDILESGKVLEKLGLYPAGKKISDLPFRNNFYRWIGKIHLDNRNGMSYGFLAWQLPAELSVLHPMDSLPEKYKGKIEEKDYFTDEMGNLNLVIYIPGHGEFYLAMPKVTVLTQRSGCDKTNFNPEKDLLKMGIENGKMFMEAPTKAKISSDYKPSFDTKVILAHAVGNALIASILAHIEPEATFTKQVVNKGVALSHWHGYLSPESIPDGWYAHGFNNPHVACSTPHSAIFAIDGKLKSFIRSLEPNAPDFLGDVHIEPHHGTNINFTSLKNFAAFLEKDPKKVSIGNKYLTQY